MGFIWIYVDLEFMTAKLLQAEPQSLWFKKISNCWGLQDPPEKITWELQQQHDVGAPQRSHQAGGWDTISPTKRACPIMKHQLRMVSHWLCHIIWYLVWTLSGFGDVSSKNHQMVALHLIYQSQTAPNLSADDLRPWQDRGWWFHASPQYLLYPNAWICLFFSSFGCLMMWT